MVKVIGEAMPRKKKLVIGDKVAARFLGSLEICTVVHVIDKNSYKLEMDNGTIIPNCFWKQDADKKSPWFIEEYIGSNINVKSTKNYSTNHHTLKDSELGDAIERQKKFLRGDYDKG